MLEKRQTDQVEIREEMLQLWGRIPAQRELSSQREDLPQVWKDKPLCQILPVLESSTSSGESSRKVGRAEIQEFGENISSDGSLSF